MVEAVQEPAAAAQVKKEKVKKEKPAPAEDLSKKYKRKECEDLLKRKFFYTPSFEIYGGVSGFYDFGPLGCAVKNNIEALWRAHYVLEEDMLELGCSNLMLSDVLKTSGHVEKFEDLMVKDLKTGTPRRADKIIQEWIQKVLPKKKKAEEIAELEQLDADVENFGVEEIDRVIAQYKIKDPDTGNDLGPAQPFNLMFDTQIGPTGHMQGYLRPETAQGIFINFRRLAEYNNGRMPFAAAQIGMGYRNEISPRQGLLRVREFTMAEIEHFVDPQDKSHPKFETIADVEVPLLSAAAQDDVKCPPTLKKVGEAVADGLINNQTMAYFVARTYQFLTSIGIRKEAIRFRQHRSTEMAHYANDCWDAEVETSYGWIEVAGHSDRSAFDLTKHMDKTKVEMMAARRLPEPITTTSTVAALNKQVCGKAFKKDGQLIAKHVEELDQEAKTALSAQLEADGEITLTVNEKEFKLTKDHISFSQETKTTQEEKYVPHVIEPSFGIGRILYCVFEHCFKVRAQDAQRTYFDFPPQVAPLKCSLLPLLNQKEMNLKVAEIKKILTRGGVSCKVDDTGVTVGKRYARTDECGIPFGVTVDHRTLEDNTVTIRYLDTMEQIRLPVADLASLITSFSLGHSNWQEAVDKYGLVTAAATAEDK